MTGRTRTVAFFIHLIQDVELLFPVIRETVSRGAAAPVWVTDRVWTRYPEIAPALRRLGAEPRAVPYAMAFCGLSPSVRGWSVLVTAAESTDRAHRVAHVLTRRARRGGVPTFTLQNGFEQPGLTFLNERVPGAWGIGFASETILVWANGDSLDRRLADDVRRRCVAVGCTKEPSQGERPGDGLRDGFEKVVAVFSNLHWERYADAYRRRFFEDLRVATERFPRFLFLLRPHPNNRWAVGHPLARLDRPNWRVADPASPPWRGVTSASLLACADAALTTPSTVAFDAARAGVPVAVAGYGLELDRYAPLTVYRDASQLDDFLRAAVEPSRRDAYAAALAAFRSKASLSEGGAAAAAERILEAAR